MNENFICIHFSDRKFQFFIPLAACAGFPTFFAIFYDFHIFHFHFSSIFRLLRWVQTSIQCEAMENIHRLLQLPTNSSHYWRENLLLSRWIESWLTCKCTVVETTTTVDCVSKNRNVIIWYVYWFLIFFHLSAILPLFALILDVHIDNQCWYNSMIHSNNTNHR